MTVCESVRETAVELLGRVEHVGHVEDLDELLTPCFVLNGLDGISAGPPAPGARLGQQLKRLARMSVAGPLEEAGGGFVLAGPAGESFHSGSYSEPVWLVRVSEGRLAAAFEFERRGAALAAIPTRLRAERPVEIVERAIWAFVHRDVSTLLACIADDHTYADLQHGRALEGGPSAVAGLLLADEAVHVHGLVGLELRELAGGVVAASGRLKRQGSQSSWRWRVDAGVAEGQISWTVRHPDERLGR